MDDRPWPPEFERILREQIPLLDASVPIPLDGSLFELGVTSAALITLLNDIEDKFVVEFDDTVLDLELFSSSANLWANIVKLMGESGT